MLNDLPQNGSDSLQSKMADESAHYLHMLLNQLPVGVVLFDEDGLFVDANPKFCSLLGRTINSLIGLHFSAITPKEFAAIDDAQFAYLKQHDRFEPFEKEYFHADGRRIPVRLTGLHVRNVDKTQIWVSVEDISNSRQAEVKLARALVTAKQSQASADSANLLLHSVFDRINDGCVALDSQWRYTYVNPRAANMLQRKQPDDLIGKHIWTEYPEGVGQNFYYAYLKAANTQRPVIFEEYYQPWDQWYENRVYPSPDGITIYFTEITARKKHEEVLNEASTVFQSTKDGIMVTDLHAKILNINPAFTEITGYQAQDVLGKNSRILKSGQHNAEFYESLWSDLLTAGNWSGEIIIRRKNNEVCFEWLTISTIYDAQHQPLKYVGVFSDITQLKDNQLQLERLAHYDPLTQLPNRILLTSRLNHSLEMAKRDNKFIALLMLDLDHFKDINDSYGHLAGDELLKQAALRLSKRLRSNDSLCRLGGDEFIVVLDDLIQPADAARVASEIISDLSAPFQLSGNIEVRVGVSAGISLFPQNGVTADELIQQADTSLYQAKKEGRGRFKYFSEEFTTAVRHRLTTENRLRRATKNNEFVVYYQPLIEMKSGRIIGAEALVRWLDPEEGLISPLDFIPTAETTAMIATIGGMVLKEACRQGRAWIDSGLPPLQLAVNVSTRQFLHSDIEHVVEHTLKETGFPATKLEIEITESALMEREDDAIKILTNLRQLGVRLAIDDFGTGYSSLSYLKKFPLDILKIDKSFIDDIPYDQDDIAITNTVIAMAHALRLDVLAEGVETPEQLAFLKEAGCQYFQGYLISPPVPADEFEKLVRRSLVASLS